MPVARAQTDLIVNDRPLQAGIGRAMGSMQRYGSTSTRILGGVTRSFGLTSLSAGALAAISVKLAREQEQAEKKLEAVLKATGGAAGYNAAQLKQMASELQGVTNFGDEATISMMAVLGTFKEVRGPVFKEAVERIQDMSAVLGQDLQSGAIQLGKALNDPIRGITALSRVGVSFTEQQKEQIKALQEAGDMMGAQRVILQELKSEFGGAAREMVDPWIQMKNAIGDICEMIGSKLLPAVNAVAKPLAEAVPGIPIILGELGKREGSAEVRALYGEGKAEGMAQQTAQWEALGDAFQKAHGRLAENTRELLDWEAAGKKAEAQAVQTAKRMREVGEAVEKVMGQYFGDELNEMEKMVQALEKAGASYDQIVQARQRMRERDVLREEARKAQELEQMMQDMHERLRTHGMEGDEALIARATRLGADEDTLESLRYLRDELAQLDQQAKDMELGKQLALQFRTPLEVFEDKIAEYQRLLSVGAFDYTAFNRAIQGTYGDLERELGPKKEEAERGHRARFESLGGLYKRISAAAASDTPEKRTAKATEEIAQTNKANAETLAEAKKMLDKVAIKAPEWLTKLVAAILQPKPGTLDT